MTCERAEPPTAFVSTIESLATRRLTPCGGGSMLWREWGEGRPLVLLHGAGGSWTHWIRNILPLAQHFRVLVPDMPGFGDSDTPPEPHTAGTLADIVAAGTDVLVPPPTELDLAGFSFGGIVGGLVSARRRHRVRTLVFLGPGGMALPHPAPPLVQIESGVTPPDEVQQVHRENLRKFVWREKNRRARFKSRTIWASDALLKALPLINARITGIWGGRDAFVGPHVEDRQRLLASFQRDLDFRVIEGAGHWVVYEAADQVNAALLDMLRATPSRSLGAC
ncbi:MAG: hypothetical protein DMD96_29070 [Candidatus Rokuibacteriota bacterium]|nr:MAG: hypothetical protein DMD96_29070 [Candidatus Rokubacteria bacterium]